MVDPTLNLISDIIGSISNESNVDYIDHDISHDLYTTIDAICQSVDSSRSEPNLAIALDQTLEIAPEEVEDLDREMMPTSAIALIDQVDQDLLDQDLQNSTGSLMESESPEFIESEDSAIADQDEINDVEMPLFDHLEELRGRIFYAIATVIVGIIGCFVFVNKIVYYLEIPAHGVKFLQLSPGEYFFVSIKVAGYSGLLVSAPMILYQVVKFVLPGLTKKEKQFVAPIVFGSSILFVAGVGFAYIALIPAALNFFINYGGDVVEQLWSIDRYFEFVLLLLFSTGLAFQIPIVQALLGAVGIVSSRQMLSSWRYVILGALVLGGVLTPSTDPLTQSLLAGAVGGLYFGGIGLVKLMGR